MKITSLSHLNDDVLRSETKKVAAADRAMLVLLLTHIREVDRRRLYAKWKYQSINEYVIQDLGYSEDEAGRRVAAMRLMRDVPEIAKKMEDGSLSLSNVVLAQTMFRKERRAGRKYSRDQKKDFINKLENRSSRDAQKIVGDACPEMRKKDLTFNSIADESLRDKLLIIKGAMAHTHPDMSLNEILHYLCDAEIQKIERKRKGAGQSATSRKGEAPSLAAVEREVWRRAGSKCTNCGSTHALQIDHIQPVALGGSSTLDNMRLLCRSCNQRAAIHRFGMTKMSKYIR